MLNADDLLCYCLYLMHLQHSLSLIALIIASIMTNFNAALRLASPAVTAILLVLGGGLDGVHAQDAVDAPTSTSATTATMTVCVTAEQCKRQYESLDLELPGGFYVGEYATKGCFLKGDNGYFGTGSTADAEMATTDLPGVQERLWCDISVLIFPGEPGMATTAAPTSVEIADTASASPSSTSLSPTISPSTVQSMSDETGEEEEEESKTDAPSVTPSPSIPPKNNLDVVTKAPTPLITKKPTETKKPTPALDGETIAPSISLPPTSLTPTISLSPSVLTTAPATTETDTAETTTPSTLAVDQPSIAPTPKPSYEKALPLTGPIQCTSLLTSSDEEIPAPTLDGIADEWTNITVYDLPLTSSTDPTKSYPYGNGAVQMQCVYDDEKVYFVFHVPGRFGVGEEMQMNAAISTMFKLGTEASLSNMGGCPSANDCTTALDSCEDYKVDWQLLSSQESSSGSTSIDDKYSVTLDCRYDDDADDANGGDSEWEGAWMHFNLTASSEDRSSSSSESTTEESSSENDSTTTTTFITMAEVRKHNSEFDLWMVLENKVYDFTDFAPTHPGGPGYLTMYAGMDATDPFQAVHYGVYARAETKEYYIGDLDMSSVDEWVFEVSRPLKTDSTKTDVQFEEGQSVDFGFSFWDPYETEERGWTNSGYYTTGSTKDWTTIQFGEQTSESSVEESKIEFTTTSERSSASTFTSSNYLLLSFGCTLMVTWCSYSRIL